MTFCEFFGLGTATTLPHQLLPSVSEKNRGTMSIITIQLQKCFSNLFFLIDFIGLCIATIKTPRNAVKQLWHHWSIVNWLQQERLLYIESDCLLSSIQLHNVCQLVGLCDESNSD